MENIDIKHPGEHLFDVCIKRNRLTITEAAAGLGVTRNTLSRLVHGHHGISPEMAVRLSLAFGDTPEMWLRLQTAHDLAHARRNVETRSVKKLALTPRLLKTVIRKGRLDEQGSDDDLQHTTPEQRIGMMWPLAQDAWAFKGEPVVQSRLSRHTVRLLRQKG